MTGEPVVHLRIDRVLAAVWVEAGLGDHLLGLAAASDGEAGAAVAVTADPIDPDLPDVITAAGRMAAELGLDRLRLLTTRGPGLGSTVRDWLYQAAQGSGRGVSIELAEVDAGARLEVRVSSWDSSARELLLRLGSGGGSAAPEVAALARVLGYRSVLVCPGPED